MARRNGAWVPIIAFLLGLIAVVLSFLAYSKRVKVSTCFLIINIYFKCNLIIVTCMSLAFLFSDPSFWEII